MSHELTTESIDDASRTYLGQWHRLVSTTNWEKGRIIHEWRQALIAAGAPPGEYSDDAWSRRVGNVTAQHVGRLRRVYERFGGVHRDYAGLFWSHFQAAIDWNDAEMWLEGAVQNHWSVEEMRRERWQAFGAIADQQPRANDLITADLDEDASSTDGSENQSERVSFIGDSFEIEDRSRRNGDGDNMAAGDAHSEARDLGSDNERGDRLEAQETPPFRPFADLPPLPDDLNEAFESFKLAILRHKTAGWLEISRDDLLLTLDSLKALATAPA
jgi:hypothetical protein